MITTRGTTSSQKKRESERRARQRRVARIQHMRGMRDAFERMVVVAHTVHDDDAVWEDFLDPQTIRLRRLVLGSIQLTTETRILQLEQVQLQQLLGEHQLWTQLVSSMMIEREANDWAWKVDQMHELTRKHYKQWTRDECQAEMDTTLKEMDAFQWSPGKLTTGISFLGWRELRRIDHARGAFQFQFSKTFHGYDMMDYVNAGWDAYTDAKTYKDVIVGHRLLGSHEILQQLGPNLVIARGDQRYPSIGMDVHMVFLVFRVHSDRGITQCVRSICAPELMKAVDGPRDMWASNFIWLRWEPLTNDERSYKVRIGGSIGGTDPSYLNQWMMKIFGCMLSCERLATGRQLITAD